VCFLIRPMKRDSTRPQKGVLSIWRAQRTMSQTGYPTAKENTRFFYWLLDYPDGGRINKEV
jgi:hypothetical protein